MVRSFDASRNESSLDVVLQEYPGMGPAGRLVLTQCGHESSFRPVVLPEVPSEILGLGQTVTALHRAHRMNRFRTYLLQRHSSILAHIRQILFV